MSTDVEISEATRRRDRARPQRCLFAVAASLAAAALTPIAPAAALEACTLPGAGAWRTYQSSHFLIDVAQPGHDPAMVVGTLEELRAAVLGALVAEPVEVPGRARVILLPARRDLERIVGRKPSPTFTVNAADPALLGFSGLGEPALFWISALGQPAILIAYQDLAERPQAIAHELAHYLSRYLYPRQAYWFREGLAQFVESVGRRDGEGRRWAGEDPTRGQAGTIKLTRLAPLMAGDAAGLFDDPYLTTFVLYRFLWNERGRQLTEYQRRLSEGEAPGDAWSGAFPEWSAEAGLLGRLDDALARHQRTGRGLRWEVKVGGVDRTFTPLPTSSADLHMLLLMPALLVTNELQKRSVLRSVAQEALREDATHPEATAALASLDGTGVLEPLRAAAAARPDDGRAWYLLGGVATDPAEAEAALRRATSLWPDGAAASALLAGHLASTGRAREALAFANQAVDLAPWSPDAIAALAWAASGLGKCSEAVRLQARAVDVQAEGALGPVRSDPRELRHQLDAFRRRCAGSTPAATPGDPAR